VVTATPTAIPPATPTAWVVQEVREVQVTSEPQYIRIPVEVTVPAQVIQVEITATPTATPALASGTVRICTWAAGVREVYVDGSGMVPGSCVERVVGVGASYLQVQINR
jgi:hypothetical protein